MKVAAVLLLTLSAAEAFTAPSMTFAVGKKPVVAKKVAPAPVAKKVAPAPVKKAAPAPVAAKKAAPTPVVAAKKPLFGGFNAAPKPAVVAKKPEVAKKPVVVAKKPVVVAKKPVVVAKKPVIVKAVIKKAPAPIKKIVAKKSSTYSGGVVPSTAIPGEVAPDLLNGSLIGDVGFDPCFLSTRADSVSNYFNGIFGNINVDGLTWYREAELMHGRICMVAVLGFIWPGFSHFSGNAWTGVDAYSFTNPLEALDKAPGAALLQIFAFMGFMEFRRITIILNEGSNYMAGDSQKWGQGAGRWNPFKFDYTSSEYAEKQLQEIKHARLAMIAFLALVFQANASGVGVVDQLAGAFTVPEYAAKAGYFLPQGI